MDLSDQNRDENPPRVDRLDSDDFPPEDQDSLPEDPQEPDDEELKTMAGWVRWGCTKIDPADAGERLDRYLARRFTYRSRTDWAQKIRQGRIRIDEKIIRPSYILKTGDMLQYRARPLPEPEVDSNCPTVYEDDALLAVSKSGNIPVHPAGRYFRNSLLLQLEERKYGRGGLFIVHRLDRETSGVILFTKSSALARNLSFQFENRKIEKSYLAVVWGRLEEEQLIDLPLGQNSESKIRKAVGVVSGGRLSRTRVRPLSWGDQVTLVEARPLTGRLHQIRVHLRAIGHPILGDKLYGKDEGYFLKFISGTPLSDEDYKVLGLHRQALHAWKLTVEHPVSGERLEMTAPPAADLDELFKCHGLALDNRSP